MGMSGISKSQVSRLCEEIDGKVKAFLNRPLEGDWPYLWIDATYLKVRRGGRIVSVAVIIIVAVAISSLKTILDFIGAFASAYISYVVPPLWVIQIRRKGKAFRWLDADVLLCLIIHFEASAIPGFVFFLFVLCLREA